jgi:hypothetical protein
LRTRSASLCASFASALLLAAAVARAGSDGAPSLRARPPALVLGGEARATLEIEAAGEALPRVSANVGRIERLRAVAPGRFEADYVPPPEAFPQVAIVAAVAGGRCGWISIPLAGRGVAVARSAPHATIRVTIDGASFGPVRADASGEAQVPVVVPAGTRFAFHRGRPLDLEVPPALHVHAVLGIESAPADAEREIPVWLLAVTPPGAPRAAAPVEVAVTHGTIDGLAERAPGELAGTWRVPAGDPEPAVLTARLSDEPGPTFRISLARPGGPRALVAPAPSAPPAPPPAAPAVPPPAAVPAGGDRLEVSAKAGLAASAGGFRSAYLGAEGIYRPDLLGGRVGWALEAGTFARARTDGASSGGRRLEVRGEVRYVPVTVSALWHLAPFGRHSAWMGAGGGAAWVRSDVAVAGGAARAEDGVAAVGQGVVGWGYRAGRFTPYAEARVSWHADPRLETMRGSLALFTFALGARHGAL